MSAAQKAFERELSRNRGQLPRPKRRPADHDRAVPVDAHLRRQTEARWRRP